MNKHYWMVLALVFAFGIVGCDSGSKNPVEEAKEELNSQKKENNEEIEAARETIKNKTEENQEIEQAKEKIDERYKAKVEEVQAKIAAKQEEVDNAVSPVEKDKRKAELAGLEKQLKELQNQIDDIKNNPDED